MRALAAGVGMSEPAVRERLNGMRRAGVITGYGVELDPAEVGRGTAAFVALRFTPAERAGVDAALRAEPAVLEAHEVAGEDCYLVKVRVASTSDLADLLDRLRRVPGMAGTRSTVVLRTVSGGDRTPQRSVAAHHVERVRDALLPLCEPLHDVLAWADQRRRAQLPELVEPPYLWHATHTVRALAHHRLSQLPDDLGQWRLTGNHAQNGPLWLSDGSFRLRILHSPDEHTVPPPGSNMARQAHYANPPLAGTLPLFGPTNDRLLGLWRIGDETGAASIRIVRPIGDWKWGAHQVTDLDFILPDTTTQLANLRFTLTDEGLSLELPMDDEEAGKAGGVAG